MGYRSDIAIKIYGNKEKVQKVKDFADAELIKLDDEQQENVRNLIAHSEENLDRSLWEDEEDEASFFFFAHCVKWYDGYPLVDYFKAIFKKAKEIGEEDTENTDDEDSILYGEYVRIGEDMDDNEEERFNTGMDDQVTIVRSIEY
jgi:hypothetical protein